MLNETEVENIKPKNPKVDNLTRLERLAIKQLFHDRDITIKLADKGSTVVIQDTTDCMAEAQHQLYDSNFYSKQDSNLTPVHNALVHQILSDMFNRDKIDETCYLFLYQKEPKTPRFVTLPKIHKQIQARPTPPHLISYTKPR